MTRRHAALFAREGLVALTAVAWLATALVTSASAQTPPSPAATPAPAAGKAPVEIPVSQAQLDHIRRALANQASMDLDDQQLRFYAEVIAKEPRFSDYVKGYDLMNGPTKGGDPMSYREFVDMMTPKDMYAANGVTAVQSLGLAITNYLGQSLIKNALADVKKARSEREVQEIRDRIDRELAALNGVAPQ